MRLSRVLRDEWWDDIFNDVLAPGFWLAASLCTPCQRDRHVARTAEQSIVVEPALAAPIRDGNNMIGFPSGTRGAPCASRRAIRYRRFRTRPLPMCLEHVETTDLTNAFVSLLDLLTNVPGTTSNLPFVNAGIAAESASRRLDDTVTPAADRIASGVALGLSPLIGGNDTRPTSAHAATIGGNEWDL